jgi:hypothetical protein
MHLLDNSGEITPKDRFFKYLADLSKALLLNLSVNYQKQAQNNAVVVQQKEMDRVGFKPTTSAMPTNFYLAAVMEREIHSLFKPTRSALFLCISMTQLLVKDLRTEDCFIPSLLSSCSGSTSFS